MSIIRHESCKLSLREKRIAARRELAYAPSRGASIAELRENLIDGLPRLCYRLFFSTCQGFEC